VSLTLKPLRSALLPPSSSPCGAVGRATLPSRIFFQCVDAGCGPERCAFHAAPDPDFLLRQLSLSNCRALDFLGLEDGLLRTRTYRSSPRPADKFAAITSTMRVASFRRNARS